MHLSRLLFIALLSVACYAFSAPPAQAVDYDAIDRTLEREPDYQSDNLRYALLLFGPDAEVRVWIVVDEETVYLDRNADGDLTADDERFSELDACKNIEISGPDDKTGYVITSIGEYHSDKPPGLHLMVNVEVRGDVEFEQYCDAGLGDSPQQAPIAHFDGPFAVGPRTINWKYPSDLALTTGDDPADLAAMTGTISAEYGCWVVVWSHDGPESAFPDGVVPKVKVEFPPKTPDGPRVTKKYTLDEFC